MGIFIRQEIRFNNSLHMSCYMVLLLYTSVEINTYGSIVSSKYYKFTSGDWFGCQYQVILVKRS